MPEAVAGHSASPLPLSCGEMPNPSATRRALFGMAAGAAALLAVPAAAAGEAHSLALFREWVDLLHHKCPPRMSAAQREREWDRVGDRQTAILDELRDQPASLAQMCAVIWIAAWDVNGSVDASNPALPGEWTPVMRSVVECAARLDPRLAAIAGLK